MIPRKPRPTVELSSRRLRVVRPAIDQRPTVVVGVTSRVPVGADLERCLDSVAAQTLGGVGVVLLIDGVDSFQHAQGVSVPAEIRDRTWVLAAHCGTAARARNAILDFIDDALPAVRWVARLDADDVFAAPRSLEAAVDLGERSGRAVVLGGNRVLSRDGEYLRDNPAAPGLRERGRLLSILRAMAEGTASNELPSCNLLARPGRGLRYPDKRSAEDHWLVADLLFHRPHDVAVLEAPLFVDYRLDGDATRDARRSARHRQVRRVLHDAAATWARVAELPGEILGLGQEGIVRMDRGTVFKHFYPGILSPEKVAWFDQALTPGGVTPAPTFEPEEQGASWVARYPYETTREFVDPDPEAVRDFLRRCLEQELVCANIKRPNFRIQQDGRLLYVDVGNWVIPMDVSFYRDAAARLYSIGVRGASDDELQRRETNPGQPEVWHSLPGFADFYGDVVGGWVQQAWDEARQTDRQPPPRRSDVTLLLKACAMDVRDFRAQAVHLVDQLTRPRDFARRLLLVDPYRGPFLRQHAAGDLDRILAEAGELVEQGLIDEVLVGPTDPDEVLHVNRRWFGVAANHTHSADGVPVTPQVWAFDQVETRYVLQADLDVLVGRRDLGHDYLAEMIEACGPEDVVGVAFNIPHPPGLRPYDAPPGEFKPEVRLGLLDLERVRALRPLPATAVDGRLSTTWYRALHGRQRELGLRTVRGGDSATFYLHPPNNRKGDAVALGRVRDLVGQGWVPDEQLGRWDLEAPDAAWTHQVRPEPVVVLARGRNTSVAKLRRFSAGLGIQDHATFGVIAIDDSSDPRLSNSLREELAWLGDRLTLVRNPVQLGRTGNNQLGVTELCGDPEAMIVVVDLDDALAHPAAVSEVARLGAAGHDVVLAAPFRPDAPTHVYEPTFDRIRETYGGDVWIHLRAFRKRLFDQLPDAMFEVDGQPVDEHDDYAAMIPIAERARSPVYLPRYRYWHERATVLDEAGERERDRQILRLLAKGPDGRER